MSKPKALLLGKIDHPESQAAWNALSAHADLLVPASTNRADFLAECASGAFDGVVAAYRTFASASITGLVDAELVAALPASLKYICHNGAGYDQIDVHACAARSPPILVSNVPTAVDDATADVNLFLLLGALRMFNPGLAALRRKEWKKGVPIGHDPQGKTLGILGMGGIGRALKKRTDALGMKCIYHNRNRLSPELEGGATYVSFEELLRDSDVISLNLPLNKNTRHIISTAQFTQMKDGVVIVNTARGAVIDEAALVAALDSGKVFSAGLDVYENEPEIHPGLIANERVLLVPHLGTNTVETQTSMELWCIENARLALTEGKLKSIVPEQVALKTW